jgi:hypothetical protein
LTILELEMERRLEIEYSISEKKRSVGMYKVIFGFNSFLDVFMVKIGFFIFELLS